MTHCYLLAMRTYNQTPLKTEQKIISLYNSGLSSVQIQQKLGINPTTILYIVKRNGFSTRTTKQTSKRYTFNERFFERINTEEKAYWLGFILADGCISRGKDIIIVLKKEDRKHLEKFIENINGNNKIQEIKNNGGFNGIDAVRLAIRSQKMYNDLIKCGITERKSLTAKVPSCIPENFIRHFWRGLVDGDGHICVVNTQSNGHKYTHLEVGLCGTKNVVYEFENYTKRHINTIAKIRPDKMIWRFSIGGKENAIQLCSLLYDDSVVSLDRKLKIYEQYKQINVVNPRHPS